jgi:hypothetical protein
VALLKSNESVRVFYRFFIQCINIFVGTPIKKGVSDPISRFNTATFVVPVPSWYLYFQRNMSWSFLCAMN